MASSSGSPERDAMKGRRLGHYLILEKLGAGGMGEVYLAEDATLRRKVALKMLPPELAGSSLRLERFELEARTLAALDHPNIVTIHSVEEADGLRFITMAWVQGRTLAELIPAGGLPLSQCLKLASSLADGLLAAHERGIVHRDLKPANVMVDTTGRVRILDFGLAKQRGPTGPQVSSLAATESKSPELTREGAIVGTYPYMSPEQVQGRPADARSDIFAFGVVLYEMATGERPFRGESPVELVASILKDHPRPLVDVRPELPPTLWPIVERCLRKDPAARFQSTLELREALAGLERSDASGEGTPPGPGPASGSSGGTAAEVLPGTRRGGRTALVLGTIVLACASLAAWVFARRARAEADHRAAIAEVERLVDQGRFVDVWRVATAALKRWPGDAKLDHSLRATTHLVTIASEPAGAEVAFRAYDDTSGEWLPLGTTPLRGVRAPVGQLRWKLTKAGFEPLEARLEVGAPAAAAGRPDEAARPIRLRPHGSEVGRMVFVPGGPFEGVELGDFWIDEREVTNREFKGFVDRGGYEGEALSAALENEYGQAAAREKARGTFRDRTGRPGPATWELGRYAEGMEDHPVGGVSWFEADAYCRSAGKSLPTVYHWRRAFGANFFVEVLMLGNFAGRGPEATTRLKEVGPYGTYGMAGNVKEWVWNGLEGKRYILGGAWNEPVYMAVGDDRRPPLERAETDGFRCVKEAAPSAPAAYAAYGSGSGPKRDYAKERPVGDAEFEIFRRFYSYERTPLEARVERVEDDAFWRRERVSFAAAYGGERVLANILLPKDTRPPYQAVVWFPGSYALDLASSEGDLVFSYYFDFLPRSGRALVYPVYSGTYERRGKARVSSASEWRETAVRWAKDLGRTIDYLESRSDFAPGKIAYYGFSMGADVALPAVALEPRLKALILLGGGLYPEPKPPETDPFNFVPRIKAPVLVLGGSNDFIYPVEMSQRPLVRLLGTKPADKKHVVFDGAGHVPPRLEVVREVLDWLDRYLGPVGAGRP